MGNSESSYWQSDSGGTTTLGQGSHDYPATDPRYPERSKKGVDGKTTYSEGVNVGHRWFDKEGIPPLYPFGFV
jgi:beta-glucosidase